MNGGPEGSLRSILIGDGGYDLRGWDSLENYFSVGTGFHFIDFEMFESRLHSTNLAQSESDVGWIGEGAFVLEVHCWLKATSHCCRRDLFWSILWVCSCVGNDISAPF